MPKMLLAIRRGLEDAGKAVVIADGVRYNWEIVAMPQRSFVKPIILKHPFAELINRLQTSHYKFSRMAHSYPFANRRSNII